LNVPLYNKRNQAATWSAGFTDHIAALQRKDPTPKFKTKYCTTSATYEEMLLINFGGLIHKTFKETESYSRNMFLPLWKNPKEDSGESLTGVLIAVKERLMEYDVRERALAAVKTSWSRALKENDVATYLRKVDCSTRAEAEVKKITEFKDKLSSDNWFPKQWSSIYYFGEPAQYQNHLTIPSLCKPARIDSDEILGKIRSTADKATRRNIDKVATPGARNFSTPSPNQFADDDGTMNEPKKFRLVVSNPTKSRADLLREEIAVLNEMIENADTKDEAAIFRKGVARIRPQRRGVR
jgi:hypothetical protein